MKIKGGKKGKDKKKCVSLHLSEGDGGGGVKKKKKEEANEIQLLGRTALSCVFQKIHKAARIPETKTNSGKERGSEQIHAHTHRKKTKNLGCM